MVCWLRDRDDGEMAKPPARPRAVPAGLADPFANLRKQLQKFLVVQINGHLPIADSVCVDIVMLLGQISAVIVHQVRQEGGEQAQMLLAAHPSHIFLPQYAVAFRKRIDLLHGASDLPMVLDRQDAAPGKNAELAIQGGLWNIRQLLRDLLRRHPARASQQGDDADADRMQDEVGFAEVLAHGHAPCQLIIINNDNNINDDNSQ